MAVFDATQNQVLFSPVTNYYQGKAIRAGLAAQEQDAELKGLQIDIAKDELESAPERKRLAAQKAAADYDLVLENVRAKKLANQGAEMDAARDIVGPWIQEYDKNGIEWANENFDEMVLSRLPEKKRAEFMEAAGPDKVLDEDEIARMGLMIAVHEADKSSDPTSHQKHLQSLVDQGYMTQDRMNQILESIEVKAGTITGTTEFDPARDPRTGSQRGADFQIARDSYNTSSDIQEMISNALPQVIDMPGTVGIKGAVGQGGAGFLSSMGQDQLAEEFSQWMTGASPEDIAQIQTQLQAIRGRIIPLVTGEQGKRLSETEREIASKAVGLIEGIKGPADLTKAYPQVLGAMKQLYAESWAEKYRLASREENIPWPYDLSDEDEVTELVAEFRETGIDEKNIRRAITRLISIQGVFNE